jgi:pimeloyl-ACP methyl ester carboxylesterase
MTTQRVTLPQGDIEYNDYGDGPPVVFCHGLLVDGQLWTEAALRLSKAGYRCLVPTLPLGSHRIPMRPDADLSPRGVARLVADFCAALDLRDVTLTGNDTGGVIAQLMATEHGDRVGRLVLTNCDALEVFPPKGFEYVKLLPYVPGLMFVLGKAMLWAPPLRRLPMAYGALTQRRLPSSLLRSWVEPAASDPALRRDVAKFARGVSNRVTLEVAEVLRRFDRPVLLLWGDADRFFPLSLAERLRAMIPNARLQPVRGGGLLLALDCPEAVADGIAAFIRGAA